MRRIRITDDRPWSPEEAYLLPPSPLEWPPDGHLAFFLGDFTPIGEAGYCFKEQ